MEFHLFLGAVFCPDYEGVLYSSLLMFLLLSDVPKSEVLTRPLSGKSTVRNIIGLRKTVRFSKVSSQV